MKTWISGWVAGAFLVFGGCADLPGRGEPPQLTLVDRGLREVTLFAQPLYSSPFWPTNQSSRCLNKTLKVVSEP